MAEWDVLRKFPNATDAWGREGWRVEADSPEQAAQRIADLLPDHLLHEPFLVYPSDAAVTSLPKVETSRSRSVTLAEAVPGAVHEREGLRWPRWFKARGSAGGVVGGDAK